MANDKARFKQLPGAYLTYEEVTWPRQNQCTKYLKY